MNAVSAFPNVTVTDRREEVSSEALTTPPNLDTNLTRLTHLQSLDNPGGVSQSDAATERSSGAILSVDHLIAFLLCHGVLLNVLRVSSVVIVIVIS